jgi:hypothetical protein
MFIRNADWDLARESFLQARTHWPACAADWLQDGRVRLTWLQDRLASSPVVPTRLETIAAHLRSPSRESCTDALRFLPDEAERLRMEWLHYTLDRPFNMWTLLPAIGIRRVALFGGEGWGLALHRQLESAGVRCVAVIENNASTRQAAMVPAQYFSLREYLASGPTVDAVLSSLQGDHDRDVLSALQGEIGSAVPVLSWKMLFAPIAGLPAGRPKDTSVMTGRGWREPASRSA